MRGGVLGMCTAHHAHIAYGHMGERATPAHMGPGLKLRKEGLCCRQINWLICDSSTMCMDTHAALLGTAGLLDDCATGCTDARATCAVVIREKPVS